jgi:hypothetical protein
MERFPGQAGPQQRALRCGERRAIRAQVVDRLVTGPAEQFVLTRVPEDLHSGRVKEGDTSRSVGNIQGVRDGRDGAEQRFRIIWQLRSRDHASILTRWPLRVTTG